MRAYPLCRKGESGDRDRRSGALVNVQRPWLGHNMVSMTSVRKAALPPGRRRGPRGARPGSWQLQDAKARFSEVVRLAKQEGPQHVTVHGREEVVVVGADDFRRLAGDRTGRALVEAMRQSPHRSTDIEPSRSRMRVRDVDL